MPPLVLRLLLAFTVFAAGVLGIEALARHIEWGPDLEESRRHANEALHFLEPCGTIRGSGSRATLRITDTKGDTNRFPLKREEGKRRVLVLGESTGGMLAGELQALTSPDSCAPDLEILNCAQPGSGLSNLELRYDETKDYGANTVVVVFGHNLFREYPTNRDALLRWRRFSRSRLFAPLLSSVTSDWAPQTPPDELGKRLEGLLEKIRQGAQLRDQQLILTTLSQNLWFPPLMLNEIPRNALEAELLLAQGRWDEGVERLWEQDSPRATPLAHFQMGTHLHRVGRTAEAGEHLWKALDLDGATSTRAPRWVNETIRQFANTHSIPIVDMERRVVSTTPDGLPGWESFDDNCHLTRKRFLAEVHAFLEVIAGPDLQEDLGKCSGVRSPAYAELLQRISSPENRTPDWWTSWALALAVERWNQVAPAQTKEILDTFVSSRHFKQLPSARRGLVLAAIAEGNWHAGNRNHSETMLEAALETGEPRALFRGAFLRLHQGDTQEALRLLERASALAPGDQEIAVTLNALRRQT